MSYMTTCRKSDSTQYIFLYTHFITLLREYFQNNEFNCNFDEEKKYINDEIYEILRMNLIMYANFRVK